MTEETGAVGAIIVAAGRGHRMGFGYNKVLAPICGRPVIEWTLRSLIDSALADKLILVVNPDDRDDMDRICRPYVNKMDISLVLGGPDRQDSVYNGLRALPEGVGLVLIHDGARPFADRGIFLRGIQNARKYGAACAGVPVKDTIKRVDEGKNIISTPPRKFLWSAQTPQVFKTEIIVKAYDHAFEKGIRSTDDAGLAEAAGFEVKMFLGGYKNIKLTSPEDILLAEQFMKTEAGKVE